MTSSFLPSSEVVACPATLTRDLMMLETCSSFRHLNQDTETRDKVVVGHVGSEKDSRRPALACLGAERPGDPCVHALGPVLSEGHSTGFPHPQLEAVWMAG